MVYDEGFDLKVGDRTFFAFFKYIPQGGSIENSKSDCQNTLVGWYNNLETKERGCFKGSKGQQQLSNNVKQDKVVQPSNTNEIQFKKINNQFEDHQQFSEEINKQNLSWQAKVSAIFENASFSQLNRKAGRQNKKPERFLYHKNRFSSFIQIKSSMPKEFTWKEYMNDPIQQHDCGSCYAVATITMIQARLKINHGEDRRLSIQNVLDCNYYNQGCDGGYGYLVSKFGTETDLYPLECKTYLGYNDSCESIHCDVDNLKETYRIKEFGYIGGAYGLANEEKIMQEIYENGPVVMSFEPKYDFMYYSNGIYKSMSKNQYNNAGYNLPEWEKVDHSVCCYGWGEENGIKFWECINSWGKDWGEQGHFRILKGADESHIESMGEFAIPIIVTKSNAIFLQKNFLKRK